MGRSLVPWAAVIRELEEDGVRVKLDLGPQILELDAPDEKRRREPALSPTPSLRSSMLSAAVMAQKAKQFDDALYAAVERAVQRGFGSVGAKSEWLCAW